MLQRTTDSFTEQIDAVVIILSTEEAPPVVLASATVTTVSVVNPEQQGRVESRSVSGTVTGDIPVAWLAHPGPVGVITVRMEHGAGVRAQAEVVGVRLGKQREGGTYEYVAQAYRPMAVLA